jgi:hypothetical protein
MMASRFQNAIPALSHYNADADFFWIKNQSRLPWLKLIIPVAIPIKDILDEIVSIQPHLCAHRENYNEHQGWKSFCIHGKSYDATREDSYYNDSRPHVWTNEAQQYMPNTVAYFQTHWPAAIYRRIRVMLLEPGGYITVHSDSVKSNLGPINIALTQPAGCRFVMEKHGVVPFLPGDSIWLDLSNRHTVFNDSDQPRWHIIVHQELDHPEFQELVVKSYHRLYNNSTCDRHDS